MPSVPVLMMPSSETVKSVMPYFWGSPDAKARILFVFGVEDAWGLMVCCISLPLLASQIRMTPSSPPDTMPQLATPVWAMSGCRLDSPGLSREIVSIARSVPLHALVVHNTEAVLELPSIRTSLTDRFPASSPAAKSHPPGSVLSLLMGDLWCCNRPTQDSDDVIFHKDIFPEVLDPAAATTTELPPTNATARPCWSRHVCHHSEQCAPSMSLCLPIVLDVLHTATTPPSPMDAKRSPFSEKAISTAFPQWPIRDVRDELLANLEENENMSGLDFKSCKSL
mmetsp:Transcript_12867/g.25759  ORF Transcript_12867/g.25759 Transcript_12867/m.25759 type:complete len:281 (-) Transcript_12867:1191-2033(-)